MKAKELTPDQMWPFDFELVAPGLGNPVNCKVAGYAPSRTETESFPQPMR
jgi:hypothetical protein